MNKDQFEGQWNQIKGKIKEKWGKLTDDDLTRINGKHEQLYGRLQERYGYSREQAEREFNSFNCSGNCSSRDAGSTSCDKNSKHFDKNCKDNKNCSDKNCKDKNKRDHEDHNHKRKAG